MKFTISELKARELEHRHNVKSGIHIARWNKSLAEVETSQLRYKTTQLKLANALEELRRYRENDPEYKEEE